MAAMGCLTPSPCSIDSKTQSLNFDPLIYPFSKGFSQSFFPGDSIVLVFNFESKNPFSFFKEGATF